ncbi:MAG: FAD-dependent oxidoreductase [Nanoarchaeota archaeon]|nr:FAD-dependent oxidoreductase [Nanoarchaeota archaeon]
MKKKVVILGAGITGLVSAYYLSEDYDVVVIEKGKSVGGSAAGFKYKDFIMDYGPHKIYSELPGIMDEIEKVVELNKIKKKNSIYLEGNYFEFPLKIQQIMKKMPSKAFKAGWDMFAKSISKKPDDSYENYLINRFGKTMYNLSFRDYAEKVWGSNPKELDKELAKRRVAITGMLDLIKGILFKDTKNISADYFYYPPKGIKQLIDNIVDKIKKNGGRILTNENISEIKIENNMVKDIKIKNGIIKMDYMISTIPLDEFVKYINADEEVLDAASKLRYQKLNILYFILNKPRAMEDSWRFYPEKKLIFQRVSEMKSFSQDVGPEDKTVLMVETIKDVNKELVKKIIEQLEEVGLIKENEIEEYFLKSYDKSYPVYTKGFKEHLSKILEYIEKYENFYSTGRPGLFNYNNMDQCWDMAMKTAEHIKEDKSREDWQETKTYFDKYRIVD